MNHNGHPMDGALVGVGSLWVSCDKLDKQGKHSLQISKYKGFYFLKRPSQLEVNKNL